MLFYPRVSAGMRRSERAAEEGGQAVLQRGARGAVDFGSEHAGLSDDVGREQLGRGQRRLGQLGVELELLAGRAS